MDYIPKILLVDDHEVNIEVLEANLTQTNYQIEIFKAMDGLEALKIVEKVDLDLVLLDVMLPGLDGFEVCRRIKSGQSQTLPVIMITALHDRESLIKGLEAGADDFLTKPVDRYELLVRVNNLLQLRKVTSDLNNRYIELKHELEMARKLQQGFLPQSLPGTKGLELAVLYQPSIGIGGDFYDFLYIDEQSLGIFIADVTGHGVSSAMITAVLKDNIRKNQRHWSRPEVLFKYLNREMYHFFSDTNSDYFVTAFYGILDLPKNKIIYTNAGHPAPLQVKGEEDLKLDSRKGLPLGIFQEGIYEVGAEIFLPGDKVYLFTDGLLELEISPTCQLTDTVLYKQLIDYKDLKPKEIIAKYEKYILQLTGAQAPNDDINLIVIERLKKQ